jgi:hypothetical protein
MNWGKRILMIAGLLGVFASGTVGCSKSSSSNNGVYGNASMSGVSSTASDTVNGMPISLNVSSVYQYGSPYVTISINGATVTLQPVSPASYQGAAQLNISSQYTLLAAALCMDQTNMYSTYATACQTTAIVLWAQPVSYYGGYGQFNPAMPAMQMGLLRYADGTFHSTIEKVGYPMTSTGAAGSPALSTATDLANWMMANHN